MKKKVMKVNNAVAVCLCLLLHLCGCTTSANESEQASLPSTRALRPTAPTGVPWSEALGEFEDRGSYEVVLMGVWEHVGKRMRVKDLSPTDRTTLRMFWAEFLQAVPRSELLLTQSSKSGGVTHHSPIRLTRHLEEGILQPSFVVRMDGGRTLLAFPTTGLTGGANCDFLAVMVRGNEILWHRFSPVPQQAASSGDSDVGVDSPGNPALDELKNHSVSLDMPTITSAILSESDAATALCVEWDCFSQSDADGLLLFTMDKKFRKTIKMTHIYQLRSSSASADLPYQLRYFGRIKGPGHNNLRDCEELLKVIHQKPVFLMLLRDTKSNSLPVRLELESSAQLGGVELEPRGGAWEGS